jgi:hypothetical protein
MMGKSAPPGGWASGDADAAGRPLLSEFADEFVARLPHERVTARIWFPYRELALLRDIVELAVRVHLLADDATVAPAERSRAALAITQVVDKVGKVDLVRHPFFGFENEMEEARSLSLACSVAISLGDPRQEDAVLRLMAALCAVQTACAFSAVSRAKKIIDELRLYPELARDLDFARNGQLAFSPERKHEREGPDDPAVERDLDRDWARRLNIALDDPRVRDVGQPCHSPARPGSFTRR